LRRYNKDFKWTRDRLFGAREFTQAVILTQVRMGYDSNVVSEFQRVGRANPHANPTTVTTCGIDVGNRLAF
jgi:hypothetical protein